MKHIKLVVSFFCLSFLSVMAFPATGGSNFTPPADFDGDGKTDIAIYRSTFGQWWVRKSSDGSHYVVTFGTSGDRIVPADYTGDGKADIAIFRPSSGEWFILRSEDFSYYSVPFGLGTDIPVPADYDGDGKTDIAVWRDSNATWYIQRSLGGYDVTTFGLSGDKPVPADYDGDGKADVSISRNNQWWTRRSSDGAAYAVPFGNFFPGYTNYFFPSDFTGDGLADEAFYFSATNNWAYRDRVTGVVTYINRNFVPGLIPVPGDYDGDRRMDVAMYNLNNSIWTIYYPSGNVTLQWGSGGDTPVPFALTER